MSVEKMETEVITVAEKTEKVKHTKKGDVPYFKIKTAEGKTFNIEAGKGEVKVGETITVHYYTSEFTGTDGSQVKMRWINKVGEAGTVPSNAGTTTDSADTHFLTADTNSDLILPALVLLIDLLTQKKYQHPEIIEKIRDVKKSIAILL